MTNDRFTNDQCPMTNDYFYQTGDLARWLPVAPPAGGDSGGVIEFLGRIDHQVKIRGFRIEPGEIEALLHKHPAVRNAFVTINEDNAGEKSLAAFVTLIPQTMGPDELEKSLRDYLSRHVPAYMVPADFILLDSLPLTTSGKVDRKKLVSLRIASRELGLKRGQANIDKSHEKPRSRIESILANTWAEVLGVPAESIGIYDSFMILGGDSIKAVQVAARLQRYHLTVAVGDILLYPQIANLAPYIKERRRIPSQLPVTGPVLPLPIMQKFLFDNKRHVFAGHHFNQSQVLFREAGFTAEIIRKVFEKLIAHHDALRMTARFAENDFTLSIQATDVPFDRLFHLEIIDLTSKKITGDKLLKFINSESNRIQAGLNLEQGPLVRLGLFKTYKGDYLLIVIHHLVIDGISWRILLEDFETAYRQIQDGQSPETLPLPLKTDSYLNWTKLVHNYAEDSSLLKQKNYWHNIQAEQVAPLPVDNPSDIFFYRDSAVCDMELPVKDTRQLLTNANRAYTTETNDLILAALTLALHAWTGKNVFKIDIEGHGRETGTLLLAVDNDTQEELDLSRTIGWFTTSYPIVLKSPELIENDEKSCLSPFIPFIQNVKETLRRIPDHGFGFGILEYLTPNGNGNPVTPLPGICFNYLGEITSPGIPTNKENKLFNILDIPQGSRLDPNYPRLYRLDLRARVMDGKFQMAVTYNRHEYQKKTILQFTRAFKNNLRQIIQHCTAQKQTIRTVSDFFAGSLLTPSVLQIINERFGLDQIEDIYPLTPMQEGMLYYWLQHHGHDGYLGQRSRAYFQQLEITLSGLIDPGILENAFKLLLKQHEILRSVLICDTPGQPLRATLKLLPKSWGTTRYDDIPLEDYKIWDRDTGFDLIHGPLVRLALFKTGDNTFTLIWSFHHILMDGWCIRMVLGDLLTIYSALSQGKTPDLPITQPYSFYLRWLARQNKYKDKARQYWSNYLAGLNTPTIIPPGKQENAEHSAEIYFQLDELLTHDLHQLANRCSVTLNTVLQCLWGLLLMECNHNTDIVFGSVVSGRPPEIRGVEHMIGLFINTQPVRVTVSAGMIFSALLARMQRDNVPAKKYEFFSLADIQALSPLKNKLISHIMVVENYPVSAAAPGSLSVLNIQAHEQSNYDFSLIVRPGKRIQFKVIYNPHAHDSQWINETFQRLISLARQVTSQPDAAIAELGILPLLKNDLQFSSSLPLTSSEPVVFDPPSTGWEKLVADAWAEILGIDISTIGRNHDFFALGGHSLKGMYLSAHIRQSSGIVLEPGDIFKNPTLKEIAQCLEHKQRASSIVIPPAEKRHFYPVTAAQKRMFLLHGMEGGTGTGYNIPMLFEMHGQLDIKRLETAFEKLCQRHETLRTSFHMLENGEIIQKIEPMPSATKPLFEKRGLDPQKLLVIFPFDLSKPPLFRAILFAVAE
ncbi:MAG: condensation domain-containing protein, partial [Acidobacteria bacterium]|nr:condensation domain-containing protein [Acidobacteriota bacterium]